MPFVLALLEQRRTGKKKHSQLETQGNYNTILYIYWETSISEVLGEKLPIRNIRHFFNIINKQ